VPQPREQGSCSSCVGQAVAAAVQMSLAYTTRQPVGKFNVSARALYYCVAGGRTCKTGVAAEAVCVWAHGAMRLCCGCLGFSCNYSICSMLPPAGPCVLCRRDVRLLVEQHIFPA
jgi:hypothetical protein